MNGKQPALSLLFLTVLAAGCINGGISEGGEAISVHSLDVQPAQMYEGSDARVSLELSNQGNIPAEIDLGELGQNVMTDYCADSFENKEENYNIITTGDYNEQEETVELDPGRDLSIRWRLEHTGDVPLHGYECNLRFQVPFDYSVSAYSQVEIKQDRSVQGSESLSASSSRGPLAFAIESIGSSADEGAPTFIGGEDQIEVLLQLQTQGDEGPRRGLADIDEGSLQISATEPLELDEGFEQSEILSIPEEYLIALGGEPAQQDDDIVWSSHHDNYNDPKCDLSEMDDLRMHDGDSRVIRCPIEAPEVEEPAITSDIEAEIDYTYIKNIGTRSIQVESRGN